jgi:hypothetical protein
MLPIADMRQVVATIDDRPRHSGDGCNLRKRTPWPADVASPVGLKRPTRMDVLIAVDSSVEMSRWGRFDVTHVTSRTPFRHTRKGRNLVREMTAKSMDRGRGA